MPIDNYEKSFEYLTRTELPDFMKILQKDIKSQRPMSEFAVDGAGVVSLYRKFSLNSDFSGCYLLLDKNIPVYVGISRSVLKRLRQHVRGKTHFDASLAYRIASSNYPHNYTRSQAMKQDNFKIEFENAKKYLRSLNVAYVAINNPLILYIFEPYCAMHFDTTKWNTFETH